MSARSIPALLTPFRDGGRRIDLGAFDKHLEWLREAGIESVLVAGTTGEGQSLSISERVELAGRVKDRHPCLSLMAATGFNALPDTIEASRRMLSLGVDSLLVAPPCFFPSGNAEVFAFFSALAEALPDEARLVMYHIPRYTGAPVSIETARHLREEVGPVIAGLKDSGGQREYFEQALAELQDLALYGSDGVAELAFAQGATGVISALANVVPNAFLELEKAVSRPGGQDPAEVRGTLAAIRSLTHSVPQRSGLKYLAHLLADIPQTCARPPELDLQPSQIESLRTSETIRQLRQRTRPLRTTGN